MKAALGDDIEGGYLSLGGTGRISTGPHSNSLTRGGGAFAQTSNRLKPILSAASPTGPREPIIPDRYGGGRMYEPDR